MATSASEAAKAVNALMGFSSDDQDALLEVLQDYFSSPDGLESDEWEDDDSPDDNVGAQGLLQGISIVYTPLINKFLIQHNNIPLLLTK